MLTKNNCVEKDLNKTLLLAPIRVSPISNLFEGLIGYYFKIKGYRVKALICDQSVNYCDNVTKVEENKRLMICSLCKAEQKRFSSIFGFESISIKKSIKKEEIRLINNITSNYNFLNNQIIINGIDYTKSVTAAVIRYTLKSEIDFENDVDIIRGYLKTALITNNALEKIKSEMVIDHIILSHGIYSQWGTVLDFAKRNKIPSYVWARGYVGQGNLIFGKDCSYLEDVIKEDKSIYQSINYKLDDLNELKEYYNNKRYRLKNINELEYINYYDEISLEDINTKNLINDMRIKFSKIFGMFTNIPWDGQVFNQSKEFPNTEVYLKSVIDWFVLNKDCALIIRTHPAELDKEQGGGAEKVTDLIFKIFEKLPENVLLIDPGNSVTSYDVAEIIDASIVYGSTIGLELAHFGIPVIQAGMFSTTGKEIVFEAKTKVEMYDFFNLVKLGQIQMSKKMKINALNYLCYWSKYKHIYDDTVVLDKLRFIQYRFNTIEEFSNSNTLEFVFNKIILNSNITSYAK